MPPIAIFYHCLFYLGQPPELKPHAVEVVKSQIGQMKNTGLLDSASEMIIGINGGDESKDIAHQVFDPKAKLIFHGLESRAENLTIVELEKWVPSHPEWLVLYLHAKGCTHVKSAYGDFSDKWRECMMKYLVQNWRTCVADLKGEVESVGCHFMRGMADGTQNIWAGNFFWAKAKYLATLPSIYLRERIKMSGIAALESRYESEVWIGNGARLPIVKEYLPNGGEGCP